MRLIDADAMIEEFCGDCAYKGTEFCSTDDPACGTAGWVKDAPTVDAVPVVHGKWIRQDETFTSFMCSNCGTKNHAYRFDYCSHCGARMDGEEHG